MGGRMMKTAIESLKIVVLCIVAAIAYGILHDQVTARVCVEYFTIGAGFFGGLVVCGWVVFRRWRRSIGPATPR
jgi:hypothetical protein